MQSERALSRSQDTSAVKAGRVLNSSVWSRSVATPLAVRMPRPQIRVTLAALGKLWRACSTRTGPLGRAHFGSASRIMSVLSFSSRRTPMRSATPSTEKAA